MIIREKLTRARENLAKFVLERPSIGRVLDDPLLPNRLTSKRQQEEIRKLFRQRDRDECTYEAIKEYQERRRGAGLILETIVGSMEQVIGGEDKGVWRSLVKPLPLGSGDPSLRATISDCLRSELRK